MLKSIAIAAVFAALGITGLFSFRVPIAPLRVAALYYETPVEYAGQFFENSLLYNLEFWKTEDFEDLKNIDLLIADASLLNSPYVIEIIGALGEYAENGGYLAITNQKFLSALNPEAAFFSPFSFSMGVIASGNARLSGLARIYADYADYFSRFVDFEILRERYSGEALFWNSGVVPIAQSYDGRALAAVIPVGDGEIFYFGALLPDIFFTTNFDMLPRDDELIYFNHTAAAATHLLWSELAALVSLETRGFALWRVFGSHGRPSMAHQNHIEVLSAVGGGAIDTWALLARDYQQIASISLTYGLYEWFEWHESFGYALGTETGFENDRTRNFYSWGEHIIKDDAWLNLRQINTDASFFLDSDLDARSYPAVLDYDRDGVFDIVSGSSDGFFHVFRGKTLTPRWEVKEMGLLRYANGAPVSVGAFSAPVFSEEAGLFISGAQNGSIYVWNWRGRLNIGNLITVIPPPSGGLLSAPDIFYSNGSVYIIAGYSNGDVYLFEERTGFAPILLVRTGIRNASPRVINSDFDLIIGGYNGDIIRFNNQDGQYYEAGALLEGEGLGAINFKNTPGINSGNNITPLLIDINGDGILDLVWGLLEYGGFAVALSDPLFPYREELAATLELLSELHVPVLLHSYTHNFKSEEDESAQIKAELDALIALGVPAPLGVNQHTWRTSGISHAQTLRLQLEHGFLWNSGFAPSNSPADPAAFLEFGMLTPFYLSDGENKMLIYNSNYLYNNFRTYARYDMPVSIYKHVWRDALFNQAGLELFLRETRAFQEANLYNFVTEEQMFRAMAAAMATEVRVLARPIDLFLEAINALENNTQINTRFLVIEHADENAPLFNANFANSVGVLFKTNSDFETDSPVLSVSERGTYMSLASLNKDGVKIIMGAKPKERDFNILSVNLPAQIKISENEVSVLFLENGLQQIFIRSVFELSVGENWDVREISPEIYKISYAGNATELIIKL